MAILKVNVRGHTTNPVPALVIGAPAARRRFVAGLHDLTHVAPAILDAVGVAGLPWNEI